LIGQGVPRPVSVQREGSQSAPVFRLTGNQTLRQQLLKYANIYCPVEVKPCWLPDKVIWR